MAHAPKGPIDSAVLDEFRGRARTHPLVEYTESEPSNGVISTLIVYFDSNRYPDPVVEARLEIQWYRNGDYNFHYYERHTGGPHSVWQCRWDNHPNPHASYAHFHEPPHADSTAVVDDPVRVTHPTDMLTRTLARIEERITLLWDDQ